ncbi:low molecular weight protein-tyrosine-phosphatase [Acidovorax lacteus]|uniref:Low molecular weight protein-tyrosine-phosphatase n=1 Tax=Acidovorax lacteus TaxID=1924988 RepID=A0ABP8L4V1_9BURK
MTTVGTDYAVLFVCMGNICRSPTAHGVFRAMVQAQGLAERVQVDSAGTHDFHVGEPPDRRAQAHAERRGYRLHDLRARALAPEDFEHFDLVLAMDWDNLALAQELCPPGREGRLRRLTEFCQQSDSPVVPDPYYGGAAGFEQVLDLVEDACAGLLQHVRARLAARDLPADGAARH